MSTEQQIQTKIIAYAKLKNYLVIKTIKLSTRGHADIMLFKDGKTIFIEVKNSKGGIKSELQKIRQKQFRDAGFIWEFVNDYDEFKKIIK
jgi:hypothetical protein